MKLAIIAIGVVVVLAATVSGIVLRRWGSRSLLNRSERASIMDPEPDRMSLFSADHVRMLSDAQIRAIERGDGDEA